MFLGLLAAVATHLQIAECFMDFQQAFIQTSIGIEQMGLEEMGGLGRNEKMLVYPGRETKLPGSYYLQIPPRFK